MTETGIAAVLISALKDYPWLLVAVIVVFTLSRKTEAILEFINKTREDAAVQKVDFLARLESRIAKLEEDNEDCNNRYYELRSQFANLEAEHLKMKLAVCPMGSSCPKNSTN